MAEKLDIFELLKQANAKNKGFYDSLSDEMKKGFAPLVAMRWMSVPGTDGELGHYYIASANHYVNKNFFDLSKHPKLQWLLMTAAAPGLGNQRHQWIGMKKKESTTKGKFNKVKILQELHPTYKQKDIELLAALTPDDEIKDYLRRSGEGA
jgi:hypothetical protein